MLRTKGLTDKLIVLGIDGMDPRFSKAMVDEGKMPNLRTDSHGLKRGERRTLRSCHRYT